MFVRLICHAKRLERRRIELLKEKQDAIATAAASQRRTHHYRAFCTRLRRLLRQRFSFPKHSRPFRLCFNVSKHGTCENFVAKSVAGFLGGFALTYVLFMFFVLQLNFTLSTATIMCALFGSILTIGLAFSVNVRCVVFLVLPQFFSKKGRQALLAYAYILAITGPAKNTLNNMSILGESLACGQEQLKAAVRQILDVIRKPFTAIKEAIVKVVVAIREIVRKIKKILLSIKRTILSLVKVVKSAFDFVARTMNMCNHEFGTPFQRCERVFEDAVLDCNAKLGPYFNWMCNVTYLVRHVCHIAKALDFICSIVDFIKNIINTITTKVKQFVRHIRTMFYVRIKFSHSYHFESNHSKSMGEITTGIVTEIKQRSSGLIRMFDFMSSAASIFFIFMVVKVIYYRHKFLTNEMFDNKFITKDLRKLDLRRAQLGLETVLPLNHRERKLYISTSSMRLVKKERSQLSQAAMILLMSTLKLSTHMATDYSLYWIMTKIRFYGRFQSKIDAPNLPGVHIEGEGFLAALLKGIVIAFIPLGGKLEIDTVPCLPDPIPPDYDRYIQIGSLLILCWVLAIFEPYGLRFRHSVMCYYNPLRARERAIWLYNHILRSRSSFLKFARRQLRRKVNSDKTITKITCTEYIRAQLLRFPVCVYIIGTGGKQESCLLCGDVHREGDKKVFIKCATPNCPGLFCEQCFNDLQNLCTVCLDPISYGDMSDVSEEKDSSEDGSKKTIEKKVKTKKLTKKRTKKRVVKRKKGEEDTEILLLHELTSDYDTAYETDKNTGIESDWSSNYDFDYQKYKDITRKSEDTTPRPGYDAEKQAIPELASMQDFNPLGYMSTTTAIDDVFDSSSSITDARTQSWLKRQDHKRTTSDVSTHKSTKSLSSYIDIESIEMKRVNSKLSVERFVSSSGESTVVKSEEDSPSVMVEDTSTSSLESTVVRESSSYISPTRLVYARDLDPMIEDSRELKPSMKETAKKQKPNYFPDKNAKELYNATSKESHIYDSVPDITSKETQVYDSVPDSISKETHVYDLVPDSTSKETHVYDSVPDTTSKGTHVYDSVPDSTSKETHTFDFLPASISKEIHLYDSVPDTTPLVQKYPPEGVEPLHHLESSNTTSTPTDYSCSIEGLSDSWTFSKSHISIEDEPEHPDVPRLNLEFLEGEGTEIEKHDVCTCRDSKVTSIISSRLNCNCRLFKDHVHLTLLNENEKPEPPGSSTSSLISSLYKVPPTNSVAKKEFTMSMASPDTITTCQAAPDVAENTSDLSVVKCSIDPTTSEIIEEEEEESEDGLYSDSGSGPSKINYETSTSITIGEQSKSETSYPIPDLRQRQAHFYVQQELPDVRQSQHELYKERIRNYYKHLNVLPVLGPSEDEDEDEDLETPKPRGNPIKRLWNALTSKKKYKKMR